MTVLIGGNPLTADFIGSYIYIYTLEVKPVQKTGFSVHVLYTAFDSSHKLKAVDLTLIRRIPPVSDGSFST